MTPARIARPRAGMSLLEVMIALVVLAIGLGGVLAHFMTLHDLRGNTEQLSRVQNTLQNLSERFVSADTRALGPVQLPGAPVGTWIHPWSLPRYEDAAVVGDSPPMTEADLLAMGVVAEPQGLDDLRIYCEYYRLEPDDGGTPGSAATADDRPGIIPVEGRPELQSVLSESQYAAATPGMLQDAIRADPTLLTRCRLAPTIPPFQDPGIANNKSILIRLIATWGTANTRRYEVVLAKRRQPQAGDPS